MAESLDDAFAAFLSEVAEVEGAEDGGEESPPIKRSRVPSEAESAQERLRAATALRKASYLGKLSEVKRLLQGLDAVDRLLIIDAAEEDGLTALHLAVIRGHESVASALLRGHADVDAQSATGDTPLMWAAHQGCDSICRLLLSWSADASLKNVAGQKAAMQAQRQSFRRVKDMLDHYEASKPAGKAAAPNSAEAAAAARRAANLAEVAQSLRDEADRKEEEAFWASVRARKARGGSDAELLRDFAAANARPAAAGAFKEIQPSIPTQLRGPYRILEVSSDATAEDVRKAYRKLALKHHPDKNPHDPAGAKKRFTEVALAYEAICAHFSTSRAPPPR